MKGATFGRLNIYRMSCLIIVESPAKAGTIKGYLGSNYKVVASKGHIRDLPKSSLGIDIDNGFTPHYINIRGKGDVIKELKKEAKGATKIFLATDPDREGEAISWHIADQLGIPVGKACRITFNEITKSAVKEAIKNPRPIDIDLVNSQQARRILDRLYGFNISEVLWKSVKSGLSGGRVQSVATRIRVEREEEIRAFVPQEYWTVEAILASDSGEKFTVKYFGDKKGKTRLNTEEEAMLVASALRESEISVTSVKHSVKDKLPAPPFTTSTLQQEGSKRLGFQAQKIMKVAQELYDGLNLGSEYGGVQGLITYMRTDSLRISESAQEHALEFIKETYGEELVPETPRVFKAANGAQDAHEAIRPSNVKLTPAIVKRFVNNDQYKLYKLIWERFVASQMQHAVLDTVNIEVECGGYLFKTGGYMLKSKGYLTVYDDDAHDDGENLSRFPSVTNDAIITLCDTSCEQHFTEPPASYTEASLIKFLEENGIGRPSTYAPIISIITSRQYVKRDGKALVSTPLGEVIIKFLKEHFSDIIDYEFTASMEAKLDSIAQNETTIYEVISEFYDKFSSELANAQKATADSDKIEIPKEESDHLCDKCGAKMIYKEGRYGKFLACPNFPQCRNTVTLDKNGNVVVPEETKQVFAGFTCELCGGEMVVRNGKFGEFYACSNYPSCKFTKQKIIKTDIPCPRCGSEIIARQGKGGTLYYTCEAYPECDFSSWDKPLAEKCPNCSTNLYYKKARKLIVCKTKGCEYQREEQVNGDANE